MRRKTIGISISGVSFFLICTFLIIYFNRVKFYNPLKISVSGTSGVAYTKYNLCGVTPLGKVYNLSEDIADSSFSTLGHAIFFKDLFIVFPENYIDTGLIVHITHGKSVFTININELKPYGSACRCQVSGRCFHIFNTQSASIFAKIKAVVLWQKETLYLIIGLVIIFLIIVMAAFTLIFFRWPQKTGKTINFFNQKRTVKSMVSLALSFSIFLLILYFKTHFINGKIYTIGAFLTFYGIVVMGYIFLIYILYGIFNRSTLIFKFLVSGTSFLLVLLMAEFVLRVLGINATYFEKTYGTMNTGIYSNSINSKRLLTFSPDAEINHTYREFKYHRKFSKDGFIDTLPDKPKKANEVRVLALGDSFTEGVGAPADSSWPSLLGNLLNTYTDSLYYPVFNAGVSGSDPLLEFILLTEYFTGYQPDMVVVTLNESDISDFIVRGGPERIIPGDTLVHNRKGPCWEWLFNISYVARLVAINGLGYSPLLIKNKNLPAEKNMALDKLHRAMLQFKDYCADRHIRLLVVCIPSPHELQYSDTYSFPPLIARLRADSLDILDMHDVFMKKIAAETGALNKYYWPVDGHCTPGGYRLIAEHICKALQENGFLIPE